VRGERASCAIARKPLLNDLDDPDEGPHHLGRDNPDLREAIYRRVFALRAFFAGFFALAFARSPRTLS
jgi:hypothetical protein